MSPRSNQKARIRHAAAQLWARQGYHATGMQQLSEEVGLGRAGLYHYIGSKEELLFEIVTLYIDQLVETAEVIVGDRGTPFDVRLREMSRGLLRNIADNLAEWTVFFHEGQTLTGTHRAEMVAHRDRYEGLWNALVAQGVASREVRPSHAMLTTGLLDMQTYFNLWMRQRQRLTPEQIADEFTDVILRGLLSDQEPTLERR